MKDGDVDESVKSKKFEDGQEKLRRTFKDVGSEKMICSEVEQEARTGAGVSERLENHEWKMGEDASWKERKESMIKIEERLEATTAPEYRAIC